MHIEIDAYFLKKEKIEDKVFEVSFVLTEGKVSHVLTKTLNELRFDYLRRNLTVAEVSQLRLKGVLKKLLANLAASDQLKCSTKNLSVSN